MIPELRQRFNSAWTAEKYQRFLRNLDARCRTEIHFRVCETPLFLPRDLAEPMAKYGEELVQQLLSNPNYLRESDASVPPEWNVPRETEAPMFVAVDFGLVRDGNGNLLPKLVELQGFPSLYAFQHAMAQQFKDSYALGADS